MSWTGLEKGALDFAQLKNIGNYFKGSSGNIPYPLFKDLKNNLINDVKGGNWNKSDLSYSFNIINKNMYKGSMPGFDEFKLSINPLELTQEEQFAINITPTQDGVVSEHNGIIFRDLIISGTTGINVWRGTGGASSKGKALFAPTKFNGYEEFLHLRNYFRAYAEYKKTNTQDARNAVLVFANRKDNETLIVEPIKFVMKRSASKGQLYDYEIVLKVIGNHAWMPEQKPGLLAGIDEIVNTVSDALDAGRGILLKSSELLTQLEREINNTIYEPFRQIDLMIKTTAGIALQLWHMPSNILGNFSSLDSVNYLKDQIVANPALAIATGGTVATFDSVKAQVKLQNMSPAEKNELSMPTEMTPSTQTQMDAEITKVQSLSKSFVENFRKDIVRVRDNAAEAFGLGDEIYNAYVDRAVTFVPSPTKQTTNQEIEVLYAFDKVLEATNTLLAYSSDIFAKDSTESFAETEENFNNIIEVPVPNSVSEIIIPPGKTLEDISVQYLGDYSRWTEIAVLNNLIPPYIKESSTNPRIKQYGDRLLIPQNEIPSQTNIITSEENIYNSNLTETEKRLGIDLKLNDAFDFVVNNRNDFELITGGYNAGQAIRIKLNLEQGDLKDHPEIGLGVLVGEKNVDIDLLYDQITGAILQDSRFAGIKDFSLTLEGDALILKVNLLVAESATPVPLSLNL